MNREDTNRPRPSQYNPTVHDANKARERQEVVDPERGPENKPRKQ